MPEGSFQGLQHHVRPTWSEGKGISSVSPRKVALEEDDADALGTIFCALHHCNTDATEAEALTPSDILGIAVMSAKYDLAVALKYARAQWLKPREGLELMDMGRLMTAALLFADAPKFTAHCQELILNWAGSYLELFDNGTIAQFLSFKTVCKSTILCLVAISYSSSKMCRSPRATPQPGQG